MIHDDSFTSNARVKKEVSGLFHTVVASYGLGLAGMLLATLTAYFSTRIFAPEVYGQLNMISMGAGVIQAVGFVWLNSALIRFGKEEYIHTGGVYLTFRVRKILLSVIGLMSLFLFALFYFFLHDSLASWMGVYGNILWVIPLFCILTVLLNELKGYLYVFGKYTQLAGGDLLSQCVRFLASFLLYFYYGPCGIGWLIALTVGIVVAQHLYMLAWLERDRFSFGSTIGLQDALRRTIHYSFPAVGTSIIGYIYNPIEIFIIRYFVSIKAVGLFSMAKSLNSIFGGFVMLFPGLTFPILQGLKATHNRDAVQRYYQRVVPQVTILFAIFISLCLISLPPILRLFLNENYHPAIGAFLILALAEIPHLPTALQSSFSQIFDKMSQTLWVMLFQYLFELGCYFILIPQIGIEGAAWGWFAAYFASAILLTYYIAQEFGVSFSSYYAIGISSLLGVGALLLVGSGICFEYQILTFLGMIVVTGMLTKALKLFNRQDAELLIRIGVPRFFHPSLRIIYQILE